MKIIFSTVLACGCFLIITGTLHGQSLLEKMGKGSELATKNTEQPSQALKEFEDGVTQMVGTLLPTILPAQIDKFIPPIKKTIDYALKKIACGGQGLDYYNKLRLLVDKSRELFSRPSFAPKIGNFLQNLDEYEKKFKDAMKCKPCEIKPNGDAECKTIKDMLPDIKKQLEGFSQKLTDLVAKFEEPIKLLDDFDTPATPVSQTSP